MWCVWANAGVSPPQCLSQAISALNVTHIYRYWSRRYNLFTWIIYGSQHKPWDHLSEILEIHCQQAVKKKKNKKNKDLLFISVHVSVCPPQPTPIPTTPHPHCQNKDMKIKCLQLQSCVCALYKPHSTIEGGHAGLKLSEQFCNTSGHLSFWSFGLDSKTTGARRLLGECCHPPWPVHSPKRW